MKYLLILLSVCFFSSGLYADTTFVSGTIVSETWTLTGSPYAVAGDILVASLTIEPGVMVIFLENYVFEIAGVLSAVGTVQDSIIFKRALSNVTGWQGIFFNFSVDGSELRYCRIEGATNSGIYIDNSLPTISNSTIINNAITGSLSLQGGGIYVLGSLTLNHCTIESNSISVVSGDGVTRTAFGGGIYVSGSCSLYNCIIKDNSASVSLSGIFNQGTSRGGGIYVGGQLFLTNCIVSNNIAIATHPTGIPVMEGGGVYIDASDSSSLTNSTIAYNTNNGLRSAGGGNVRVTNSIVYFNTPEEDQIAGTPIVNYSDVQGGYTGTENIDSNPVFLSQTELIIVIGSQCVDSGDPNPLYNDVCFPPSLGSEINDIGAHGGPWACGWIDSTLTNIINNNIVNFPNQFLLHQNYPNPFNPSTKIKYLIPEMGFVTLKVYDVLGNELAILVNEEKSVGSYEVNFNAKNLPSGIYFYKLQAGNFVETKKMILLK